MSKQTRVFAVSFFMLLLLVGIIGYLTWIQVPVGNKELIVTVLGVILGRASGALDNLFGMKDEENEALQKRITELESRLEVLQVEYDTLNTAYGQITDMLINRHVITNEGGAFPGINKFDQRGPV